MNKPIKRLLVANRGEIALRVMRTAKRLGIQTVAVYSDADRDAAHRQFADMAVRIGPGPSGESYLVIDRIIEAARQTGADAVHPGYGFLAENAMLAEACEKADIIFVGPRPDAIRLMGSKRQSKLRMIESDVPCVPGYEGEAQSDDALTKAALEVGLPVMIKASAGGGGRGMRLCESEKALPEAIRSARSEAENAFGNGELILEKAVLGARHVEIQVFGDSTGNIIHLGERDCSIQRRHQKVVEEAPSPAVDAALRARMGEAAVRAAKAIKYVGAGTVEFLLGADGEFYFMEMNTRLQVEHPVTELITGLDLVEWQLNIAAGEPLPLSQDEVSFSGHAIEVRLCTESPQDNFLPQTGTVCRWERPSGEGVRVDDGLADNAEISPFYDSMAGKIIAWGETRESARERLSRALSETTLHGVPSNLDFLWRLVTHPKFAAGDFNTGFIGSDFDVNEAAGTSTQDRALLAAVALQLEGGRRLMANAGIDASLLGWYSSHPEPARYLLSGGNENDEIRVRQQGGELLLSVADQQWHVLVMRHQERGFTCSGDLAAEVRYTLDGSTVWLSVGPETFSVEDLTYQPPLSADAAGDGNLRAPSDGRVIETRVSAGDTVTRGDALVVLESMKMEMELVATCDGVVAELCVGSGDQVSARQVLVEIEPAGD